MIPTFAEYLRAPVKWWADDNAWIVRFGTMGTVCSCCNSGLRRHAIIDTDGNVWGVDCWKTATGYARPEARIKRATIPCISYRGRRGWCVWANGRRHILPEIPPELLAQMSAKDQARYARLTR
jgi:hypothetical protein